jgi:hypothetical protein
VYIDANHNYENVKADINAWYPKVKKNGLIGGHDYQPELPGLRQAVDKLAINKKLKLYLDILPPYDGWLLKDANTPKDWLIIKNEKCRSLCEGTLKRS